MSLRVGIVGLGWWGATLAAAAARSGRVDIVACFARSPEARARFSAEHECRAVASFDAMLRDPDIEAVVIATPHSVHREMIEAAAAQGKHVFVEKPLALTILDARACAAAAEKAGVVLQVGHHRRRQRANRRMKQLVDDGSLGLVHQLEATFHVPKYQTPLATWRADPKESPAGAMTALGVHMIDTFHYLVGPTRRVMAYSKPLLGRWALDDATVVAFEFTSGPLGSLGTSLVLPKRCDVVAYGTEAAVWSEEDGTRLCRQSREQSSRQEEPVELFDELADQMREFAACVRGQRRPETGAAEAIAVVEVLQAIIESVRTGGSVDVSAVR